MTEASGRNTVPQIFVNASFAPTNLLSSKPMEGSTNFLRASSFELSGSGSDQAARVPRAR
jgi:hypothetical protein